ncbi:hypothetical protein [Kingella bonacorsii]|uniref:Uncharacterized protein n=1 Tax=Kingella bonacorsii TaxID=2796361 RepID=A0ABS1BUE7_9NEIS|nr:hypothetical protein [Kingella bonacorsii]MBK0396877.1 hypothetical protein [Kingella bonacorsii]
MQRPLRHFGCGKGFFVNRQPENGCARIQQAFQAALCVTAMNACIRQRRSQAA